MLEPNMIIPEIIKKEVIQLWINAVVVGCSVLPNFLKIKARPAWVYALIVAIVKPMGDNSLVPLIIPMGLVIK